MKKNRPLRKNSNTKREKENEAKEKEDSAGKVPKGSPEEQALSQQAGAAREEAENHRDTAARA